MFNNAGLRPRNTKDDNIHAGSFGSLVVGVRDYEQAAQVSRELANEGVTAIERCAGFGRIGVGKVAEVVGDKAFVGVVRFDRHPALGFKTGDEFFIQ